MDVDTVAAVVAAAADPVEKTATVRTMTMLPVANVVQAGLFLVPQPRWRNRLVCRISPIVNQYFQWGIAAAASAPALEGDRLFSGSLALAPESLFLSTSLNCSMGNGFPDLFSP